MVVTQSVRAFAEALEAPGVALSRRLLELCRSEQWNGNVVLAVGLSSEPNLAFPGTPRNEDGICRDASDQRDAFFVARVAPSHIVFRGKPWGCRDKDEVDMTGMFGDWGASDSGQRFSAGGCESLEEFFAQRQAAWRGCVRAGVGVALTLFHFSDSIASVSRHIIVSTSLPHDALACNCTDCSETIGVCLGLLGSTRAAVRS